MFKVKRKKAGDFYGLESQSEDDYFASDYDDGEFYEDSAHANLALGGSSLNTGRKSRFYNDMNPHHTRGVFTIMCIAFLVLVFLVYSFVNDFDAIEAIRSSLRRFICIDSICPRLEQSESEMNSYVG